MNTKRHCTYVKIKLFLKISMKMSILKEKKGAVELCIGETTVKAQDFALTKILAKFKSNIFEIAWNMGIKCGFIEGLFLLADPFSNKRLWPQI